MSVQQDRPLRRLFTLHLPMLAIVLFVLAPYLWMLLTSLKQESTLFSPDRQFLPSVVTLENYIRLFQKTTFLSNLGHSLLVSSGTMLVGLSVSITAAYAFSRFRFAGRRALMLQFLLVNMFPIVLLIIPLFIIMKNLGLLDTHLGLILAHSTFSIPFATWMMISYFDAIPRSLDEAAMVDGCTPVGAMFKVVIPLTVPGIIATGIYIFITSWNEYLYAFLLLSNDKDVTLSVALGNFLSADDSPWELLMTTGLIYAMPLLGGMLADKLLGQRRSII